MIQTVLTVLTALFGAVSKFFEWSQAKRLEDAGRANAERDILQANVDGNRIALEAREAQRAADARGLDPDRLSDDPFRRD